jgi:hypothetical protein
MGKIKSAVGVTALQNQKPKFMNQKSLAQNINHNYLA